MKNTLLIFTASYENNTIVTAAPGDSRNDFETLNIQRMSRIMHNFYAIVYVGSDGIVS